MNRFRNLTDAQKRVFNYIVMGEWYRRHPPQTLEALERRGLIKFDSVEMYHGMRIDGTFYRKYSVPDDVRAEWEAMGRKG